MYAHQNARGSDTDNVTTTNIYAAAAAAVLMEYKVATDTDTAMRTFIVRKRVKVIPRRNMYGPKQTRNECTDPREELKRKGTKY